MPLGIKPTVDFAFKKTFGSSENRAALIGLLNAILELPDPIADVEIKNPFSYMRYAANKLVVLDVRCHDSVGRWFNVEMQLSVIPGLMERLVYYACDMHRSQLGPGRDYTSLTPSISICLLGKVLFPETEQSHHRFQMADLESGRTLGNAIEVHTVELMKYNLEERTISQASKLEQWVFLLLRAQDYTADELRNLLPGIEFESAIHCLSVISEQTQDRIMYDQSEKAQRDYEWGLSSSRKEGREEGLEVGREQGLEVGREQGKLVGQIQLLESLLGSAVSSDEELRVFDTTALADRVASLQQRLRDRSS